MPPGQRSQSRASPQPCWKLEKKLCGGELALNIGGEKCGERGIFCRREVLQEENLPKPSTPSPSDAPRLAGEGPRAVPTCPGRPAHTARGGAGCGRGGERATRRPKLPFSACFGRKATASSTKKISGQSTGCV